MFPSASDTLVSPEAPSTHAPADRTEAKAHRSDAGVAAARETTAQAAGANASQPMRREPQSGASGFDELAFLQSVAVEGRPSAAATTADAPATRPVDPSLGVILQDRPAPDVLAGARRSAGTPMAANVTGNQPIVLRTEGLSPKSLKCTDCGAMNLPTEWYCERCGAELAAL